MCHTFRTELYVRQPALDIVNPLDPKIYFDKMLGDVNSSGKVDILDALMVAQYYVGFNPTPFDAEMADVDSNGTINILDALQIAQVYVGLRPGFE